MHDDRDTSAADRPRTNWWPWLVVVVVVVAWWARDTLPRLIHGPASPRAVTPRGDLAGDEQATIALFETASPSVVYVSPFERVRVGRLRTAEVETGTGSGFVWDDNGHIVTNYHVVAGADRVQVTLSDGSRWNGVAVGDARDKDVAVVRIDAPAYKLRPIPVGGSRDLRVGQKVFAIGNPFGLTFTLTAGVVSALDREITAVTNRKIHGVIQTDAAINPGNSGGPLLDSAGRLIGINTAIFSPSGASSGIGFAVPVDVVNDVVPQIITHGRVIRPGLGVQIITDPNVYRRLRLSGVLISEVVPGSAAERAGLQGLRELRDGRLLGDVVIRIDDQDIADPDVLFGALEQRDVGDTVELTLRRQVLGTDVYEDSTVEVTLQALE